MKRFAAVLGLLLLLASAAWGQETKIYPAPSTLPYLILTNLTASLPVVTNATKQLVSLAYYGVNFDGTAPITVTAAAGTLSGTTLNSTVVTSSLTSLGTLSTDLTMGAAQNIIIPNIKSTTGNRYVCVSTTGQLISQAAVCAGT